VGEKGEREREREGLCNKYFCYVLIFSQLQREGEIEFVQIYIYIDV